LSEQYFEIFRRDPSDFLSVAIGDRGPDWLYYYDPEIKGQSLYWRHGVLPRPKIFLVQKLTGKFLAPIFWVQESILLIGYLPQGQSINAEYYSSLLVQFKDILKEKRRGKFTEGVLFFHCNDIGTYFNVKQFGREQTGILP
jgi:hypothetical protein